MRLRDRLTAIGLCLIPVPAFAGAGTKIQACIYLPSPPSMPWTASFTAGGSGTHCMNSNGNNTSFQVTHAGITCGDVGYIEEKGSSSHGDTCATDTSHWVLAYNGTDTGQTIAYSGSTSVELESDLTHNHASLSNTTAGTNLCTTSNLCTSTGQNWNHGSSGPLYVVFQPLYVPAGQ